MNIPFFILLRHRNGGPHDGMIDILVDLLEKFRDATAAFINQEHAKMSDLANQLTAAVADLAAKTADHDKIVQEAITTLQKAVNNGLNNGDAPAIQAAITAISGASSKLASETQAMSAALAPPAAATSAAPATEAAATTETASGASTASTQHAS